MSKKEIAIEIVEARSKINFRGTDQYLRDCRKLARLSVKVLLGLYAKEVAS